MNESELQSEDSLQSVKYLGKTPSPYPHGVGIAIVSKQFPLDLIEMKNHFYYSRNL